MGSKPNGDAGNPRLVYWIRRQESDLRGLRSERSWDASNPHLNDWRASRELHPTCGLWRPVPRCEDRPRLAERGESESHAVKRHGLLSRQPRTLLRVSRTLASKLRKVSAEIPSASRYGIRECSRATAIQIRSLVPEIPRATGIILVVALGVEPSRSR